MTAKHIFCLAVSLFLSGSAVFAQQGSGSGTGQGEGSSAFSVLFDGGGYIGVYVEDINKDNLSQYGMREPRGVGVTEVVKDSPAEKAGLRKGDVILRFENESVTSARKLMRLVSEVAPDHIVRLTIGRGGAEQELSVTVAKPANSFAGQVLNFPRGDFKFGPETGTLMQGDGNSWVYNFGGSSRRIGVTTTTLTKQLADYFGISDGHGLLVTSVSEDGPAAKAGLKAGDVITAVDGQKVEDAGDLTRAINQHDDGEVTLTVVRDKSQRTIKVTPNKRPSRVLTPSTRQTRRIVVPRVEIPPTPPVNVSVPAVNVSLPSIQTPAVNIDIPSIQIPVVPEIDVVVPRVRVVKGHQRILI